MAWQVKLGAPSGGSVFDPSTLTWTFGCDAPSCPSERVTEAPVGVTIEQVWPTLRDDGTAPWYRHQGSVWCAWHYKEYEEVAFPY